MRHDSAQNEGALRKNEGCIVHILGRVPPRRPADVGWVVHRMSSSAHNKASHAVCDNETCEGESFSERGTL